MITIFSTFTQGDAASPATESNEGIVYARKASSKPIIFRAIDNPQNMKMVEVVIKMVKIVSEMELIIDFNWVEWNVFNDHLNEALRMGYYLDGVPIGLAIVKQHSEFLEIINIFYNPAEGDAQFAACYDDIFDSILSLSVRLKLPVSYNMPIDHKHFKQIESLLKARGFMRDTDKHTVLCISDEAGRIHWNEFKKRLCDKLIARKARKGFVTLPYQELTSVQRNYVHLDTLAAFQRSTDPRRARLPMDDENSFFTFRDGLLAAFCLVYRLSPGQFVVESAFSKEEYKNTGVSILPIISFVDNFYHGDCIKSAAYVYHVENREMARLFQHFLSKLAHSVRTKAYYGFNP